MQSLLSHVQRLYSLEPLQLLEQIDTGYTSTNYILSSSNDKFFLKQYDKKFSNDRVAEIISLAEHFDTATLPTVTAIRSTHEKQYFEFNKRLYSLFPFVEGKVIENIDLTEKNLELIGKLHGTLLDTGSKIETTSMPMKSLQNTYEFFEEENDLILSKLEIFDQTTQDMIRRIQKQKADYFPSITPKDLVTNGKAGIVHGDFWQRNIIFNGDRIVGLVDFDKIGSDYIIRKVMRAIDVICFSDDYSGREYNMAEYYLKGLLSNYEITQEEFEDGLVNWRTSTMLNNVILKYLVLRENDKFLDLLDINLKRVTIWGKEYGKHQRKLLDIYAKYSK